MADRADAAVRVGAMHGATVVVVHHVFRPGTALQIPEVGAESPVHASALGKALLAFAGSDVLDDLLAEAPPKLTSRTLAPGALRKAAVAEGGVARERDEAVLGASRVAPRSSITPVTPWEGSAWWATPSAYCRADPPAGSRRR